MTLRPKHFSSSYKNVQEKRLPIPHNCQVHDFVSVQERPGLERVRDLAAEGQTQVVLTYSPDRLSRKYAYQILLIEEFAEQGVETLFVKAPQGDSAEDQLLVY